MKLKNNKILIVDDEKALRIGLAKCVKAAGFEPLEAADGNEALHMVSEHRPALIILDVMMNEPDDGFFLAQKFRRAKIDIPIIMYTSVSKSIGIEFGASEMVPVEDFVEKPITPDVLIDKVEKLLRLHKVEE